LVTQSTAAALKAFAAVRLRDFVRSLLRFTARATGFRSPIPRGRAQAVSTFDLSLLETPDREQWQRTDDILDNLKIADGSAVAILQLAVGGFPFGWRDASVRPASCTRKRSSRR